MSPVMYLISLFQSIVADAIMYPKAQMVIVLHRFFGKKSRINIAKGEITTEINKICDENGYEQDHECFLHLEEQATRQILDACRNDTFYLKKMSSFPLSESVSGVPLTDALLWHSLRLHAKNTGKEPQEVMADLLSISGEAKQVFINAIIEYKEYFGKRYKENHEIRYVSLVNDMMKDKDTLWWNVYVTMLLKETDEDIKLTSRVCALNAVDAIEMAAYNMLENIERKSKVSRIKAVTIGVATLDHKKE